MTDGLETVLRLVEEGRLSPEEAASILSAIEAGSGGATGPSSTAADRAAGPGGSGGRSIRIEVTDGGRSVVNLRLPASIGELALLRIPGLGEEDVVRIREALRVGLVGDLVRAVDDSGNGVRITVE